VSTEAAKPTVRRGSILVDIALQGGVDLISRVAPPYDLNPLRKNPLRDILAGLIDFKRLAKARSSFSSPPPMSGAGEIMCSKTTRSRPTCFSRRPHKRA